MHSFGYSNFISIMTPGFILSLALYLFVDTHFPFSDLRIWLADLNSKQLLYGVVILLSSGFLGSLVGSIAARIEANYMDPRAARKLDVTSDMFEEEWYLYLESSATSVIPYVESKATQFYFEMRSGIAVLVLAAVCVSSDDYRWLAPALLIIALVLGWLSIKAHFMLGWWRHRLYGKAARRKQCYKQAYGEPE